MPDIQVDPELLRNLALGLQTIHDTLVGAKDDFSAAAASLGSDVAVQALDDFCSGWKDGRGKIQAETAFLYDALTGSADGYDDTEQAIRTAFSPAAGGPPA